MNSLSPNKTNGSPIKRVSSSNNMSKSPLDRQNSSSPRSAENAKYGRGIGSTSNEYGDIAVVMEDPGDLKNSMVSFDTIAVAALRSNGVFYNPSDPIFSMDKEIAGFEYKNSTSCFSCQKPFGKDKKNYCKFCGNNICLTCSYKKRPFPKSATKERGRICAICDRKMYIKTLVDKHEKAMEAREETIKSFRDQVLEKQKAEVSLSDSEHKLAQQEERLKKSQADIQKSLDLLNLQIEKVEEEKKLIEEKIKINDESIDAKDKEAAAFREENDAIKKKIVSFLRELISLKDEIEEKKEMKEKEMRLNNFLAMSLKH